MACPVIVNVVWQATTSHDTQGQAHTVMEKPEYVTDTTTNPANNTPVDSNDPPPTTLLRHSQVLTKKAAPTLSTLQSGTTASTPLTTGTSERIKRREKLHTLSSAQEEDAHENSEDKTEAVASADTATANMITIRTGCHPVTPKAKKIEILLCRVLCRMTTSSNLEPYL